MSILKTLVPKPSRSFGASRPKRLRRSLPEDPRQRTLMVGSLSLLLLALSIVLWHNRDFWFPDSPEADTDRAVESTPAAKMAPAREAAPVAEPAAKAHATRRALRAPLKNAPLNTAQNVAPPNTIAQNQATQNQTAQNQGAASPTASNGETPPPVVVTSRTVLPPLEVEVVAGDSHRVIRPGSNSLHVDLQPETSPEPATGAGDNETAANVTSNAADRVRMSADASAIVTSPVKPSYPMLARQMKVQGSVILLALIGKDGIIQNLRVVSGPHILASAAQDAVRQWHFKPHMEGVEAVETQAKITVNFTISTN
jgi:TonB family protein